MLRPDDVFKFKGQLFPNQGNIDNFTSSPAACMENIVSLFQVGQKFKIADRRLERIGLPSQYGSRNPFPWMSEAIDLGKEKNFFETRVTEYQTAGNLIWE